MRGDRRDRARGDARLPVHELLDLLVDDGFGTRNFQLPRFLVLLDNIGQVVDVVQVDVVNLGGTRGHVARDTQVNDQQRAIAASRHAAFNHRARQDRLIG